MFYANFNLKIFFMLTFNTILQYTNELYNIIRINFRKTDANLF